MERHGLSLRGTKPPSLAALYPHSASVTGSPHQLCRWCEVLVSDAECDHWAAMTAGTVPCQASRRRSSGNVNWPTTSMVASSEGVTSPSFVSLTPLISHNAARSPAVPSLIDTSTHPALSENNQTNGSASDGSTMRAP